MKVTFLGEEERKKKYQEVYTLMSVTRKERERKHRPS